MRISYISNSNMPSLAANSVHVASMCQALFNLKHEVFLEVLPSDLNEDKSIYEYYNISDMIKVNVNKESSFWLSGLLLWAKEKVSFIKIGPIPSILYGVFKLKNKIKYIKPNLIISRNQNWLYGCLNLDIACIFESHHPARNFIDKFIQKKIFKSKNFKRLVVISDKLKQIYMEDFKILPADKIMVLHDAARFSQFDVKCLEQKSVGYVGHLYKGRGIELILQIANELPEIKFHIIGGSILDIEKIKNNNNVSDNVKFHGHINHANLSAYYDLFDIALAPYQSKVAVAGNIGNSAEFMSPLKIFEYMCYGKSVISSDLPVLREILTNKENSLLVTADDKQEWVSAIKKLLQEPKFAKSIAQRGQDLIKQNYTWDIRAKKICEGIF